MRLHGGGDTHHFSPPSGSNGSASTKHMVHICGGRQVIWCAYKGARHNFINGNLIPRSSAMTDSVCVYVCVCPPYLT